MARMVYAGAGIDYGVIAYHTAAAYVCLRIYLYILAQGNVLAYICERAYIRTLGQCQVGCYIGGRFYAYRLRIHYTVDYGKQSRQGGIRIVDTDESGLDGMLGLEILLHQYDRGLGFVQIMGIFGIRQETESSGTSFVDFAERIDFDSSVALHNASYLRGYKISRKFHVCYYKRDSD